MGVVLRLKDLMTTTPDEREWYLKEKELRRKIKEARLEAERKKAESRGAVAEARVRRYEAKIDNELKRIEDKLKGATVWQRWTGFLTVFVGVALAVAAYKHLYPKIFSKGGMTTTTDSKNRTSS